MNITSRKDLGKLYQEHYNTGKGVEVGVQNGYNAKSILDHWKGKLFLVDIWPDITVLETAEATLDGLNVVFMTGKSVPQSKAFTDGELDWVYIDADHHELAVEADYNAWYPKVRSGGIVSGHDYGDNDCIGVKRFIDRLMKEHPEIDMHFTTDDFWNGMEYQTWWFIKPNTNG